MASQGPDVVGLQEFGDPQARVFCEVTGDTWGSFGNKDNVVIWRRGTFALVSSDTVAIPYFGGHTAQMPLARPQHLASGQVITVINVHNPADVHGPAAKWRAEALARERTVVARERAAGCPVFLVGDLNDRKPAVCGVTDGGLMLSATGGSKAGACQPAQEHEHRLDLQHRGSFQRLPG